MKTIKSKSGRIYKLKDYDGWRFITHKEQGFWRCKFYISLELHKYVYCNGKAVRETTLVDTLEIDPKRYRTINLSDIKNIYNNRLDFLFSSPYKYEFKFHEI